MKLNVFFIELFQIRFNINSHWTAEVTSFFLAIGPTLPGTVVGVKHSMKTTFDLSFYALVICIAVT